MTYLFMFSINFTHVLKFNSHKAFIFLCKICNTRKLNKTCSCNEMYFCFRVLHEHMKKLSNVITPNHKDLRIPKVNYLFLPYTYFPQVILAVT